MATPALSPTSVVIPAGGTADVSVAWDLARGTPDITGTLDLNVDGTLVSIPVTHQGAPGEQPPRLVTSNPQPGDVLVTCDVAQVELVDQRTIRLS